MSRVLLLATTTGYQTRTFEEAAARLGVDLVYATDRCHELDDPWQDRAIPIRFHDRDASVAAIVESARVRPFAGLIAVGDRPTVIAARAARELGLPGHPPEAVVTAGNKLRTRECFQAAGLPVPWFRPLALMSMDGRELRALGASISYPCVLKPLALSGSRGVMRANDPEELVAACDRLKALLGSVELRAERNDAHTSGVVEGFIPGREFAIEAVMHHGALQILAVFDKPDPLDGPFFEETIYVTPSRASAGDQASIRSAVAKATNALGLRHGPIHAECRVNPTGVFVLEVAARPIGGLCARVLRFENSGAAISLEELLLRQAIGESPAGWQREARASGVMMIPIPRRGIYRHVDGVDEARQIESVDEVRVTAKPDQALVPLPEGASYLGFIFARAEGPEAAEASLRRAHERLRFTIDSEIRVYNQHHG